MACNESVACNEGKRRGGEGERQGSLSSHTLAVVRKAKATACEVRVRQEGRASDEVRRHRTPLPSSARRR